MKSFNNFKSSSIIDQVSSINKQIMPNDGDKSMYGTAIPYLFNLYSDLIVNPSSVSISEFQKMAYSQPVISYGLRIINNLVKNEIGIFQHEKEKYQTFINTMLNSMDRSFDDVLDNMLTASWAGFSLGEKKYSTDDNLYLTVKDIQPRPPQSIVYRVNSQGILKDDGIIQYFFNNMWTGYGNLLAFNEISPYGTQRPNPYASLGDLDYPWRTNFVQPIGTVVIPKDKCVHFALSGLDGFNSPYGRSLLRSAYDSYLVRTDMTRITKNAANFGAYSIPIFIADPNQYSTPEGQTVLDNLYTQLSDLGRNGSGNSFIVTNGTKDSLIIEKLESSANLDAMIATNEYFDKMMALSILMNTNLHGLADTGTYGVGQSQQELLNSNVTAIAEQVKNCLITQLIKPLLQFNFNEQKDFGTFALVDNVNSDIEVNIKTLEYLADSGIKLKDEVVMSMLNLHKDAIESTGNPIIEKNPDNYSLYRRRKGEIN